MSTSRISARRNDQAPAPAAPAVVLAFPVKGRGGVPDAGTLPAAPRHGERPSLPPSALREWLKAALIASIAVHAIVYLVFQWRFNDDLKRAAGAAAALASEGTIAIQVEVVVESMLPSAPTPTNASASDATEPSTLPPAPSIAEDVQPKPQLRTIDDLPPPPEPAPVVLPNRMEAARMVLPEEQSAPQKAQERPQEQKAAPSAAAAPSRAASAGSSGNAGAGGAADAGGQAAVSSYFARVQAHLVRHRVYPPEARSSGASGVARVIFSLGRDGRVLSVSLAGGSGHSVLDQAAIAMVRRAAPFPPIPPEIAAARLEMGAPIRFDLR